MSTNEVSAYDVIQNLFPDKQKDYVFTINESDIVLVKETKLGIEARDLEKLAGSIVDTLSSEFYTKSAVGIGTTVTGVKDLARSFKEAQVALEVGKVFDTEQNIVCYENLGIARLIYQLPTTLCTSFLNEVFKHGSIDSLDQETLFTICLLYTSFAVGQRLKAVAFIKPSCSIVVFADLKLKSLYRKSGGCFYIFKIKGTQSLRAIGWLHIDFFKH